ncbi:MAG: autotransporter outer membrane beta-barrel domain-containing protein [Planctomycetaceae bacterium]|jgi:hypothetical protein|nr:autotransporter outer membrane beta-barrel domain-containing protein [Planctomycetaceae bacterium]
MKTGGSGIIGFLLRVAAVWFFIVILTTRAAADNYYNVQSLTNDVISIDARTGNVDINLVFDNDIVTSNPNGTVWDFDGLKLSRLSISGKSELTKILQSGTNGRLLNILHTPNNLNLSNLNLSSFSFTDANVTSGTFYNGGALSFWSDANYSRVADFDNMIFDNNSINVKIAHNTTFSASGGGLFIDGGTSPTATELNNSGKNFTLSKTDFTNNSITLTDLVYSLPRQNMSAVGGAVSILHYDVVKIEEGNVNNNSVTANVQGYVAGGGLYLSGIRSGSSISKLNFTNNTATITSNGNGTAYAGALFAEQVYSGNSNLLIPKTTIKISDTSFTNNRTKNDGMGEAFGGAVVLLHDLDGIFDKVTFENNSVAAKSSNAGGGAIAIHSFYQDSFPLTDADRDNIRNQVTTFTETTFANNKATATTSSADGGAIFSTPRIETSKSDFDGNTAQGVSASGGAISITRTHTGTYFDSGESSKIRGGEFTYNKSIATGGESLGGAIYTSKSLEVVSSVGYGDVLFRDNVAFSNAANSAHGNSIFADAGVIFNAGTNSKIEDYDGHFITGNVTKVGGGILSLVGASQHQAGGYFIREGVLRSGFTRDGDSGFVAVENLYGRNSAGAVVFDAGTIWELDLTNANLAKLKAGVKIADGEVTGAAEAIRLGSTLIDVDVVDGKIKLVKVLDSARLSDIYASAAYLHKWNTVQKAVNTRINQLLYRYGSIHGGYLYDENTQAEMRGQSYGIPVAQTIQGRNAYNAWVNYVGRKSVAGSSFDAYDGQSFETISNGIQFGFDFDSGFGSHLGFMFGYENSRGDLVNDYIRGDDYYVGAYGAMLFSYGIDMRGMLGFGHQRYKISRYDVALGRGFVVNPDGNTFEANLEFGRRFQTWHNSAIRPFIAIDYLASSVSSADEGLNGFRYNDLSLDQLFLRLGTDLQWQFNLLCFDAGVAFSQQLLDDYAKATVSQGAISSTLRTSRYGNSVFTFNVGASYSFDRFRSCSIYINYVGEIFVGGESESINSLQTGLQWKF